MTIVHRVLPTHPILSLDQYRGAEVGAVSGRRSMLNPRSSSLNSRRQACGAAAVPGFPPGGSGERFWRATLM
jgi:hypothetical protein